MEERGYVNDPLLRVIADVRRVDLVGASVEEQLARTVGFDIEDRALPRREEKLIVADRLDAINHSFDIGADGLQRPIGLHAIGRTPIEEIERSLVHQNSVGTLQVVDVDLGLIVPDRIELLAHRIRHVDHAIGTCSHVVQALCTRHCDAFDDRALVHIDHDDLGHIADIEQIAEQREPLRCTQPRHPLRGDDAAIERKLAERALLVILPRLAVDVRGVEHLPLRVVVHRLRNGKLGLGLPLLHELMRLRLCRRGQDRNQSNESDRSHDSPCIVVDCRSVAGAP